MSSSQPRYSARETARRGDRLYEEKVRPQVEPQNLGRVVAIDVESGAFAVEDTALAASNQLFARCPQAEIWFVRVGDRALRRIGMAS